ncbi:unknown [Clostridium sp. CAG:715]|nr:unknown [Clostridium sp. CAG:715]
MKYLEESNKNLISLRTSLIAVVALLTGGLVGVILTNDFSSGRLFWLIIGAYYDFIFISNIMKINKMIDNNIGVIKNDDK